MNKGNYPTNELLTKFELLNEYSDIVKESNIGDLGMLEKALQKN